MSLEDEQKREAGQRLESLRGGRSQKEFAAQLGVDVGTVQNYEAGKRWPRLDFLIRLKELTGVRLDWFATGQGHPTAISDPIDTETLIEIIYAIEQETSDLDAESKARLIARFYADRLHAMRAPAQSERRDRGAA